MKKFTLSAFLILMFGFSFGQNMLSYSFRGNLHETTNSGPVLEVLENEGVFVLDTLNEINHNTRTVYRFETNSGLQFDNEAANNFIGGTYTIELYFKFDDLNSWKRVIDWKNRKTDNGAYVYYGQLNFYNIITSEDAPVQPGEYTYYILTRDDVTKKVSIFTDAERKITFDDVNDQAIIDEDHVLNFFHDDLIVPNEASSGAVALINLYNYVLDTVTILQKWQNINGQIFGINEKNRNNQLVSYPNPVTEKLSIDLRTLKGNKNAELSIISPSGSVAYSATMKAGAVNEIDLKSLSLNKGIYFLQVRSDENILSKKIIIE